MATRDHIVLFLNGKKSEVRGGDCFLSLSDFLRDRQGQVGTKIVCSEGDCGSCTVLVGRAAGDRFNYLPIDSCIRFLFQLDGMHVVTVEGLDVAAADKPDRAGLTPIQQAMVDCHGSQCGFCTPGFVMAMTGVCENTNGHRPNENEWRAALTGNLCRCTGYTPIINAGRQAAAAESPKLNERYPPTTMLRELALLGNDALELSGEHDGVSLQAYCPTTLDDAIAFRRDCPNAKIVAGATDVGVQLNKRVIEPAIFLDLNRVAELEGVDVHQNNDGGRSIVAGARATWTELLAVCRAEVPEFAEIVSVFGSPQIRHVGTLGGNIINASPIADSLPFLFVMDAELELAGASGRRSLNINEFYQGYKKLDLKPDELLARIRLSLPKADELLRLYKVSRRRDLDIATFTAAIRLRLDGDTIASAAIAYGAVGPTVLRLRRTEQSLVGQPFTEDTMHAAGNVAVDEITPISDVRGSRDYRYQLARNVLLKYYHEQQLAIA